MIPHSSSDGAFLGEENLARANGDAMIDQFALSSCLQMSPVLLVDGKGFKSLVRYVLTKKMFDFVVSLRHR